MGSIIATQGSTGPRVRVDAHMDELGGMIRRITTQWNARSLKDDFQECRLKAVGTRDHVPGSTQHGLYWAEGTGI